MMTICLYRRHLEQCRPTWKEEGGETRQPPSTCSWAPQNPGEKKKPDDGTWLGMWVSQRLTTLQRAEDAAHTRLAQGLVRQHNLDFDPITWDCERTCDWMASVAQAPPHVVSSLREQGLRGVDPDGKDEIADDDW